MRRRERELGGHVGGSPGQRHPAAPMPVIVDEGLVPEWLSLHDKIGRTEGPQSRLLSQHEFGRHLQSRKRSLRSPALPVTGKAVPDIAAAPSIAVDWCKNSRREIAGTVPSTRRRV